MLRCAVLVVELMNAWHETIKVNTGGSRPAKTPYFLSRRQQKVSKKCLSPRGGHVLRVASWLRPIALPATRTEPYSAEAGGLFFAPGRSA